MVFTSVVLIVVFTLVFAATGAYALVRWARLSSAGGAPGARLVELFHLLMSLAMVAMAVAWTGDPATPRGIVQILVFGAFTLWFAARTVTRTLGPSGAYHVVMGAAMTWMVVAMPLMMGTSTAGTSGGGHAGHGGAAADMGAEGAMGADAAPPPTWVTAVSLAFVVLLVVAAGWCAARLARGGAEALVDASDASDAVDAVDAVDTVDDTDAGGGGIATRASVLTTARADAACHVLMSLGMAGMLVAMA